MVKVVSAHHIAEQLGPDSSWGLLFLHAFSGCDTVSFFNGIGKKTAFRMWQSHHEILPLCKKLSSPVDSIAEQEIAALERFVVLLYSKTAAYDSVNDARKYLFSKKSRQIENIPPSQSALIQHIKRAFIRLHMYGGKCTIPCRNCPLRQIGVGPRKMIYGNQNGARFLKRQKAVEN